MTTHAGHAEGRPATFHLSPEDAFANGRPEEYLYVVTMRTGTGVDTPDGIAVVDTNPVVGHLRPGRARDPMPYTGDELHHFGWNRCSSACHGPDRSHLIVPGFLSSRIYVVDVGADPLRPRVEKVIEPEELIAATGYTRPHTVALHARREHRRSRCSATRRQRRRRLRPHRRDDVRGRPAAGRTAAAHRR